jgi:hypothetical protein
MRVREKARRVGILRELRALAEEISHGHMDYAHRLHELLQSACNPNLPDVAKDFGFTVFSHTDRAGGSRTYDCGLFQHHNCDCGVGVCLQDFSRGPLVSYLGQYGAV